MPPVRNGKVKVVRTSSNRGVPSAAPSGSRSVPTDWVWSALDIARRAAMADDLSHVPSIKVIANVFTRMLEQLQGIGKNKDYFRDVTNDIASLVELVVRYAIEQDPEAERYKGVCNEFLSTITSMQSEMKQMFGIFGTSTKRFGKKRSHKDVLSSYQFRIKRLLSDLQALVAPTSSGGIFPNAKGCIISGATFTEVQGNQYIFNDRSTADILDHTNADQVPVGRTDDLDFSDFRAFKYGDLQAITIPRIRTRDTENNEHVAEEFTVCLRDEMKTARTYIGKDPLLSFKDDVRILLEQKFRHPHMVQLFGVCHSKNVPTLIFHRNLRRAHRLQHLDEPEASMQNIRMHREWQAACHYLMEKDHDQFHRLANHMVNVYVEGYDDNYSWYLYLDKDQHLQVSIESPVKRNDDVGTYYDHIYSSILSPQTLETMDNMLHRHGTIDDEHPIDKKALLFAIYSDVIDHYDSRAAGSILLISPMGHVKAARLTFDREYRFKWSGWEVHGWDSGGVESKPIHIGNKAWTRFTILRGEKRRWSVCYDSSFTAPPLYLETWVSQAERIMSQIRSSCSGYEHDMRLVTHMKCNIYFQDHFSPPLSCQTSEEIFLFVQNLRDMDDAFEIAWFWARDPEGLERLSQADASALGLRELSSRVFLRTWEVESAVWDQLRVLHELLGFTTDSLGIPHVMDFPIASLEWDGDDKGPLTPWETFEVEAWRRQTSDESDEEDAGDLDI